MSDLRSCRMRLMSYGRSEIILLGKLTRPKSTNRSYRLAAICRKKTSVCAMSSLNFVKITNVLIKLERK